MLVPPGDAEALAACLRGVLDGNAPSRARCRAYAEGFTWKRTADEVLRVYRAAAGPPVT
jgi:glycosyltransferase involved in cell wall biosynthesis